RAAPDGTERTRCLAVGRWQVRQAHPWGREGLPALAWPEDRRHRGPRDARRTERRRIDLGRWNLCSRPLELRDELAAGDRRRRAQPDRGLLLVGHLQAGSQLRLLGPELVRVQAGRYRPAPHLVAAGCGWNHDL